MTVRIATGRRITFDLPPMEKPGCNFEAIRAKFLEKASLQPAAKSDTPVTIFQTVQLYEKCNQEQDLEFFIHVFHKYGKIGKALMDVDATAAQIIRNKCALYDVTDTTGAQGLSLPRIARAFPAHAAKVILKEQFQGILPHSSFFQQDLPLLMQHNVFPGLLPRFEIYKLREVAEVLNMEMCVKLARPAEKKDFMMKTVGDFIKYSRKHVEAHMYSRLDDERLKMEILIKGGLVEVRNREFELTTASVALVNKLELIKAVYSLKYSEALEKLNVLITRPPSAPHAIASPQPRKLAHMDNFDIVEFDSLSETVQSLIRDAVEIRKKAYCPYSKFAVGAAILTEKDSKVYTGCNIENAALAPSICAERAALPRAVADGYRNFKIVAVVAHQQNFTAPCGFCRQSLSEFVSTDGDTDVYLSKPTMDKVLCTKLSKLLPLSFVNFQKDNIL